MPNGILKLIARFWQTIGIRWSIALIVIAAGHVTLFPQKPVSILEMIEWTWEVRPAHPDLKLPDVLLLGDTITRNYFSEVTKDLAGTANVYCLLDRDRRSSSTATD